MKLEIANEAGLIWLGYREGKLINEQVEKFVPCSCTVSSNVFATLSNAKEATSPGAHYS